LSYPNSQAARASSGDCRTQAWNVPAGSTGFAAAGFLSAPPLLPGASAGGRSSLSISMNGKRKAYSSLGLGSHVT
jgi:hypothetical protein